MTAKPTIILGGEGAPGFHNREMRRSLDRLRRGKQFRDLSTICVVPTRGMISARVVESWMGLMAPMNNKFFRLFISGMEVSEAYNNAIQTILDHPQLCEFKYVLTLEEDNIPPLDGLLKLYESIDEYAAVGGLYWTKGEAGQPMIYGDPKAILNFLPQVPLHDTVQECNGLGMGFTLFRLDLFREIPSPWFKTLQEWSPQEGTRQGTQDLYFFGNVRRAGHRVACDTRIRVGHYDHESGMNW
jgi:hypothetical protein